jgi:hypothetical protein
MRTNFHIFRFVLEELPVIDSSITGTAVAKAAVPPMVVLLLRDKHVGKLEEGVGSLEALVA